jgi:hypothetical protein
MVVIPANETRRESFFEAIGKIPDTQTSGTGKPE